MSDIFVRYITAPGLCTSLASEARRGETRGFCDSPRLAQLGTFTRSLAREGNITLARLVPRARVPGLARSPRGERGEASSE